MGILDLSLDSLLKHQMLVIGLHTQAIDYNNYIEAIILDSHDEDSKRLGL